MPAAEFSTADVFLSMLYFFLFVIWPNAARRRPSMSWRFAGGAARTAIARRHLRRPPEDAKSPRTGGGLDEPPVPDTAILVTLDEARLTASKMLTYANHVGLYSEEIEPAGGHIANFPQAFTHLALIAAVLNLDRRLESPRARAIQQASGA